MSTAVLEPPATAKRLIKHGEDRGYLILNGADVNEDALIDEYFEYRQLSSQGPGPMEIATLRMLVVHQKRRQAKAVAKKDK